MPPFPRTEQVPAIDPAAAERWRRGAPAPSPWLHEEVARRMAERLQWIRLQPRTWVHWEPVRGGLAAHALLCARYPGAKSYVVEINSQQREYAMKSIALPWWRPRRWIDAPTRFAMPPEAGAQMLWANMALHLSAHPQALIAQWRQALAAGGFLMFSCLGPDTARELRALYAAQGWPPASHEFTDMHDWGDLLAQAGFAEPVMDMERLTLTFDTPARLLQELRGLGRNLHPRRFGALRGRGWQAELERALAQWLATPSENGRLALSFEILYGHALKPVPRKQSSAPSVLPLHDMRAMPRGNLGARRFAEKPALQSSPV